MISKKKQHVCMVDMKIKHHIGTPFHSKESAADQKIRFRLLGVVRATITEQR
jgi:hypothetical protein